MQFLKVQENGTAKLFFLSSALWFALGTLEGITAATQMVIPDLYGGIAGLVFSRVRPMHTTTMIFGFAGSALIGSAHYIMPAVLRTSLWSEKLGKVSLWIWNLSILTGIVALDLGLLPGQGIRRMDLARQHRDFAVHGADILEPAPDRRQPAGKDNVRLDLVYIRSPRIYLVHLLFRARRL